MTATFRVLYVFVALEVGSRRLVHVNVTRHPTAAWTLQQFREVLAEEHAYRFVLHDRDSIRMRVSDGLEAYPHIDSARRDQLKGWWGMAEWLAASRSRASIAGSWPPRFPQETRPERGTPGLDAPASMSPHLGVMGVASTTVDVARER